MWFYILKIWFWVKKRAGGRETLERRERIRFFRERERVQKSYFKPCL
jgi:hypothetical protein